MANTYTQLFYHVVCVVQGRDNLIASSWKDELYRYIAGIIDQQGQKLYIINGVPNHIHILISCKPTMAISDLVREIKEHSSKHINSKKFVKGKFSWQIGFGAFTVSYRSISSVINYIKNQEEHHKTKTFKEEYLKLLKESEIEYKEEYIFEDVA